MDLKTNMWFFGYIYVFIGCPTIRIRFSFYHQGIFVRIEVRIHTDFTEIIRFFNISSKFKQLLRKIPSINFYKNVIAHRK